MTKELPRGLYEALVTAELEEKLGNLEGRLRAIRRELPVGEAPDRLALHVSQVLRRVLEHENEKTRLDVGIELVRSVLDSICAATGAEDLDRDHIRAEESLLEAIVAPRPDGTLESISAPQTPLLDTALLTNARGEPTLIAELNSELASADRVDIVMAFIRRSGIRPMLEALRRHCQDGKGLRVLTTTYTNSTEQAALELLEDLGAEVRVSYDTGSTRLHAKAWLFHRESGFTTAFIGSSNLTHSAQVTGLEWNVRASGVRNREVVQKVAATFESYWEGGDFVDFDREVFRQVDREAKQARGPEILLSPLEVRAEPFQARMMERLTVEREKGRHRNLLVSATGTGKTVMAALDYAGLRKVLPRDRILFVAHRKEILAQALQTFRQVQRDPNFGELWVDGIRPQDFEHVFASIQSLAAGDLDDLPPDHFDVVIVDEFHHAAASTYQKLLDHVAPRELLGLTATPERADGLSILDLFEGRIAAELRLWDAIDQGRLCPYAYYGVAEDTDLRQLTWKRGRGYDTEELTDLLTGDHARARTVLQQVRRYVDDPTQMKALAFCVSVRHAEFMAEQFQRHGVASRAVSGKTPRGERSDALRALEAGDLSVLFSVDLFNEGVDLPQADTLLLLRPTDSPTLFLQQLGRGLRRAPGKAVCTVLDFVGQHRQEYRMDLRYRALLGTTRRGVEDAVQQGFPFLPAGCHVQLDRVARDRVLANVRAAVPSRWPQKVDELRRIHQSIGEVTLAEFLHEGGLELDDVYTGNKCWSDLRQDAGLRVLAPGPEEVSLRRAIGRLLHVEDRLRTDAWRRLLQGDDLAEFGSLGERLTQMLVSATTHSVTRTKTPLAEGLALLRSHPQVAAELEELLTILEENSSHLHHPLAGRFGEVPLQVHGRYTRAEILAGFGIGGDGARVSSWQTGVRWAKDLKADIFAFTLDKSGGHFSPTTMYRDYAMTRDLIHWESQSVCREDSATGQRYQHHAAMGSSVMLFCREDTATKAFWFLGPATYVRHQGERPMSIVWRLETPLPGDLYTAFKAVAG